MNHSRSELLVAIYIFVSVIFRQNKFGTILLEVLKDGILPSLNLPKKVFLHCTPLLGLHRQFRREKNILNFPLFLHHHLVIKLSLNDLLQFELSKNLVIATLKSTNHVLPKFEVFIDNTLTFSLRWMDVTTKS